MVLPTLGARLGDRDPDLYADFGRFAHIATPTEICGVFRLPVGSKTSPCCIRQRTDPPVEDSPDPIVLGFDLGSGSAAANPCSGGIPRGIPLQWLLKHLSLFGMPGGGKTTAILNLCLNLYERGVPFLFFAPISGEQSIVKSLAHHPEPVVRGLAQDLQVFTPGRDSVSTLTLNPFIRHPDTPLEEHIEGLMECFKGSIPFFAALEGILRDALYLIYESQPEPDRPPTMADLASAAERVLEGKGYQGEVYSNVKAAIDVRLRRLTRGAIGNIFQLGRNVPDIEQLTGGYSLIELDALPDEESAKLILFYLKAIRERLRSIPHDGKSLRFVIFIDEAHRLVGCNMNAAQSEDFADPKSFASQRVSRMLAEFRKLGVGNVISDQSPSAVSKEVVKLTRSKLAFATVETEDRETLGGAMLFGQAETEEVARLKTGEAYFITQGYHRPLKIQTVNLHQRMDLSKPPTNKELRSYICHEPWFQEALLARTAAKFDRSEDARRALTGEIARLVARKMAIESEGRANRKGLYQEIADRASDIEKRLQAFVTSLSHGAYQDLLSLSTEGVSDLVNTARGALLERFEGVIQPDTQACLEILGTLIALNKSETK